ncbi:MAG TPA: 30S ribosomal protein S20 [Anaeromyxobacteraceae bacterium]|nr:30S ribosomal protein S20 [Anaeromyxobacteraceae bacterium]
MANTRSAEKRNRQAQRRRIRNLHVRTGVKGVVKKVRDAVVKGDAAQAREALHQATRLIDRAASKGVLHRNAASRKIARLSRAVSQLGASKPSAP